MGLYSDATRIFLLSSPQDDDGREDLEKHLAPLEQKGVISLWHAGRVVAGQNYQKEVGRHLGSSDLILFLVSPDFMAAGLNSQIERALERHQENKSRVIPVILRPTDLEAVPFAELQSLPRGGSPISIWADRDAALVDVSQGIRAAIENSRRPEPQYKDNRTRGISRALEAAYEKRASLEAKDRGTSKISRRILRLRRQLREGPNLEAGDFLLDGRFQLIEQIGQGGFAQVWKAYDQLNRSQVAIKVLHGQYARDRTRRERFARGARQMSRLEHPGVVRVLVDNCQEGEYLFYVMEFVARGDFPREVARGRLSREERLRVVLAIGEALSFAHQNQVIHRDIKPSNILISATGQSQLTDFDLVMAADTTGGTRTGNMLGTVTYAAPEVWRNSKEADEASDQYSLAMTAIFAVYGKDLPFDIIRDSSSFIDSLECSLETREVLRRATSWEGADRFESVEAFGLALRQASGVRVAEQVDWQKKARGAGTSRPPGGARHPPPPARAGQVLIRLPRWTSKPGAASRSGGHGLRAGIALSILALLATGLSFKLARAPDSLGSNSEPVKSSQQNLGRRADSGALPQSETLPPHSPVAAPELPEKCQVASAKSGVALVFVPKGSYPVGSAMIEESLPTAQVEVPAFWIGRDPVTNEQYRRFVATKKHRQPLYWSARYGDQFTKAQQPVVGVDREDAREFCAWAGLKLPSERQWEIAARGSRGQTYPWGDAEPTSDVAIFGGNISSKKKNDDVLVSSHRAPALVEELSSVLGPYGTRHQAGNVWEWCRDRWKNFGGEPDSDKVKRGKYYVLRGGAWFSSHHELKSAYRIGHAYTLRGRGVGFRVVCEP